MVDYSTLKATELKEMLKERGIPSTGLTRKQQYIEALQAEDAKGGGGDEGADVSENVEAGGGDGGGGEQVGQETAEAGEQAAETANGAENEANAAAQPEPTPADDHDAPTTEQEVLAGKAEDVTETNTPRAASAAPDEPSSDSRKRKRRSPTPPVSGDSIQKKLKTAVEEEVPKLPEEVKEDAPVPMEDAAQTAQPMELADDTVNTTGKQEVKNEDIEMAAEDLVGAPERSTSVNPEDAGQSMDTGGETGPPSLHPPTAALYIRNLLRPLQLHNLSDHLIDLATPPSQSPNPSVITSIHLDAYKSHALVLFTTPASSRRVRTNLHGQIWPNETQRKPLWVDYIPESCVADWTHAEDAAGKTRRFEVVYTPSDAEGTAIASLEEVGAVGPQVSRQVPGPGMPNAPTGPRSDRVPAPPDASTPKAHVPDTGALESLFSSTTTSHPKIFWQPVPADLVTKRLDEFDRETARDWDGGRQKMAGGGLDTLKRYTFEDGDVLVDGGADFGGFGRERGAGGGGPPGGTGFGGRGRGGFRGGRGRRWH